MLVDFVCLYDPTAQTLEIWNGCGRLQSSCFQWRCSLLHSGAQARTALNTLRITAACRGHPEHTGTMLRQHQYSEHDAELNRSQGSHFIPTVTTLLWPCASLQAHFCDGMQKGGIRQSRDGLRTPLGCSTCHFPASLQCWWSQGGLEQNPGKEDRSPNEGNKVLRRDAVRTSQKAAARCNASPPQHLL